jgi:hypothetical protein
MVYKSRRMLANGSNCKSGFLISLARILVFRALQLIILAVRVFRVVGSLPVLLWLLRGVVWKIVLFFVGFIGLVLFLQIWRKLRWHLWLVNGT